MDRRAAGPPGPERGVHLEFVMDVGRLPSGGDVEAPAEGSGPTLVTTNSRCALGGGWRELSIARVPGGREVEEPDPLGLASTVVSVQVSEVRKSIP
jgi:hypothetical protein